VPHDIAVVGAGNIHYSDVLAVPLTTVDQGTSKIGRCAAELLLKQIGSRPSDQESSDRAQVGGAGVDAALGGQMTPKLLGSRL
jgi:DNA-binding LacI/PurR family transcriptional regulator